NIFFYCPDGFHVTIHKNHTVQSATKCLNAKRTASTVKVESQTAVKIWTDPVKQCLFYFVSRWTGGCSRYRFQSPAFTCPRNDSHLQHLNSFQPYYIQSILP